MNISQNYTKNYSAESKKNPTKIIRNILLAIFPEISQGSPTKIPLWIPP